MNEDPKQYIENMMRDKKRRDKEYAEQYGEEKRTYEFTDDQAEYLRGCLAYEDLMGRGRHWDTIVKPVFDELGKYLESED